MLYSDLVQLYVLLLRNAPQFLKLYQISSLRIYLFVNHFISCEASKDRDYRNIVATKFSAETLTANVLPTLLMPDNVLPYFVPYVQVRLL